MFVKKNNWLSSLVSEPLTLFHYLCRSIASISINGLNDYIHLRGDYHLNLLDVHAVKLRFRVSFVNHFFKLFFIPRRVSLNTQTAKPTPTTQTAMA